MNNAKNKNNPTRGILMNEVTITIVIRKIILLEKSFVTRILVSENSGSSLYIQRWPKSILSSGYK